MAEDRVLPESVLPCCTRMTTTRDPAALRPKSDLVAKFGPVLMIEVGATMVGSIKQLFAPGRAVVKGEGKGLFKIGGSCVITLFQRGHIRFDSDLVEQSRSCLETFARMGDRLGEAL